MIELHYTYDIGNDRYNEMLDSIAKATAKYNVDYEIISDRPIVNGHYYGGLFDPETRSYLRRVEVKFTNDRKSQIYKALLEV